MHPSFHPVLHRSWLASRHACWVFRANRAQNKRPKKERERPQKPWVAPSLSTPSRFHLKEAIGMVQVISGKRDFRSTLKMLRTAQPSLILNFEASI